MAETGSTLPTGSKSPSAVEHVAEGKGKAKAVEHEASRDETVDDDEDDEDEDEDEEEDGNEGDEGTACASLRGSWSSC